MRTNILKFNDMKELESYYYQQIFGDSILLKADAPTLSNSAGWLNAIYGKKVWAQLNMEANVFALLPKEPWTTSGIRFKTKRGTTDGSTEQTNGDGGQDAEGLSALPYTLQPIYQQNKLNPKTVWHGFNTSELADFLSTIDDTIDLLPQLREDIAGFHAFQINNMLLREIDTVGGDGIESIDRITSSSANEDTTHAGVNAITDHNVWYQHGARGTAGLTRDADNGTNAWADAQCSVGTNDTTDRTLTLAIIDAELQTIWKAGGKPKVIITGYDTLMRWQQLLEAERRYMDTARIVPTYGGVKGPAPGVEAGFMVATYHAVPIIPTQAEDMCTDTISRIHFLDTDFVRFRTAKPTRYLESRDVFALDKLQIEGAYETIGELVCTFFAGQGKIRDLK